MFERPCLSSKYPDINCWYDTGNGMDFTKSLCSFIWVRIIIHKHEVVTCQENVNVVLF